MRALVVVGSDLEINSSANLCHIAYISGLIQNGYEVDLLTGGSLNDKRKLGLSENASISIYTYDMASLYEKIGNIVGRRRKNETISQATVNKFPDDGKKKFSVLRNIKRWMHSLYGPYEIYIVWKKRAMKYRCREAYDLVLSLSFPPASHLLAGELIHKKHIVCKKWVQLWEDPWCQDLVFRSLNDDKAIAKATAEEARLLTLPNQILYVSPITLTHQQAIFKDAADRMAWLPVPTYYQNETVTDKEGSELVWGYYGDYSSSIRNLKPFYEAAKRMNINVNICGYSDCMFKSTENIKVHPRISLEELRPLENQTNVLVFLCNLRGGQIPGKIYQYSATDKTILFILDGEPDEKAVLKEYFGKFDRYVFCENNVESIEKAIDKIESGKLDNVKNRRLDCFTSKDIVKQIVENKGVRV